MKAGQLKSFLKIKTTADLVDAVSECIRIASLQYGAINYLYSQPDFKFRSGCAGAESLDELDE